MTALLEFQRTLARAVMQPLTGQDQMKRRANSEIQDGVALVKPNSRLTSFERLEIYNRSYWSRVIDAFSEDFPGVRSVVGAKRFDRIRRRYLDDCPSQSFTMRDLGKNLVAWLQKNQSLAGPNFSLALDMAKLEWAEIVSFDAAEYERLTLDDIAALQPQSLLQVQPHLQLIETHHEVDRLLLGVREAAKNASKNERRASPPTALKMARDRITRDNDSPLIATPSFYLAIHRLELVVHYKRLDAEMFRLMSALTSGLSIEEAVEFAYSVSTLTPEHSQRHIQNSFALFAALGWFSKTSPSASQEPL
jgi:hypothetical protein